jgi:hypothetical protein
MANVKELNNKARLVGINHVALAGCGKTGIRDDFPRAN